MKQIRIRLPEDIYIQLLKVDTDIGKAITKLVNKRLDELRSGILAELTSDIEKICITIFNGETAQLGIKHLIQSDLDNRQYNRY